MNFWRAWLCSFTLYAALGALNAPNKPEQTLYVVTAQVSLFLVLYKPS